MGKNKSRPIDALRIWRPVNAQNIIMMPCVRSVKGERCEFAHEVIGCLPNLYMCAVGHGNVPFFPLSVIQEKQRLDTDFPSGENLRSLTGFLKLKW
jgi:hypothetical protein